KPTAPREDRNGGTEPSGKEVRGEKIVSSHPIFFFYCLQFFFQSSGGTSEPMSPHQDQNEGVGAPQKSALPTFQPLTSASSGSDDPDNSDDPDVTLRELLANRRARRASHKSPPTARYPSRSATKRPLYVGGDETDDSDDEFIPSGRKAPIKARKEGGRAKSTFSTT